MRDPITGTKEISSCYLYATTTTTTKERGE
jgi:hypothetical protein